MTSPDRRLADVASPRRHHGTPKSRELIATGLGKRVLPSEHDDHHERRRGAG
jgi:hypothetical protein